MAEYILTGSRSWDTTKAAQNGDGTETFWANSFLPLFNRLTTIAYYLVASGTVPASGASLNTQSAPDGTTLIGWSGYGGGPAGTLRAALESIIDQFATKEEALIEADTAPDADTTFTVTTTNNRFIHVPASLGATRSYKLADSTDNGLSVSFSRMSFTTGTADIRRADNTLLTQLNNGTGGRYVTLRVIGNAWTLENFVPG